MDYNYQSLNPVVTMELWYANSTVKKCVGYLLIRESNIENIKILVKRKFTDDWSIGRTPNLPTLIEHRDSEPVPANATWLTPFIFIPHDRDEHFKIATKLLGCDIVLYRTGIDEPFINAFERIEMVIPQSNIEELPLPVQIKENGEDFPDVEQDLKTVEEILGKYELKLTAEQKCKFLEELVKVLG